MAKNGSRMNSSDRSKLHGELSYQASLGLGNGYWDELRRKILVSATVAMVAVLPFNV